MSHPVSVSQIWHTDDKFHFCPDADTLCHLVWQCPYISAFCNDVQNCLMTAGNITLQLEVYGFMSNADPNKSYSVCLLSSAEINCDIYPRLSTHLTDLMKWFAASWLLLTWYMIHNLIKFSSCPARLLDIVDWSCYCHPRTFGGLWLLTAPVSSLICVPCFVLVPKLILYAATFC